MILRCYNRYDLATHDGAGGTCRPFVWRSERPPDSCLVGWLSELARGVANRPTESLAPNDHVECSERNVREVAQRPQEGRGGFTHGFLWSLVF